MKFKLIFLRLSKVKLLDQLARVEAGNTPWKSFYVMIDEFTFIIYFNPSMF